MSDPSQINELFFIWQSSHQNGRSARAEDLCQEYPDLLPALRQRINDWLGNAESEQEPPATRPDNTQAFAAGQIDKSPTDFDMDGADEDWPKRAGNYLIRREIARGGMGAVLRAFDPVFQRSLAVKVMLRKFKNRPELEKRFLSEARITGHLQHPGIPPAHEMGRLEDGRPYFAMKLIEGQTLSRLLKARHISQAKKTGSAKSPEELARFLSIFEQICQTLGYAHSKGVIHRDLKPANIMVGAFGEVQVMDWGLAKVLSPIRVPSEKSENQRPERSPEDTGGTRLDSGAEGKSHSDEETEHPQTVGFELSEKQLWEDSQDRRDDSISDTGMMTEAGKIMGTIAYMPPEQARGDIDQLDARCDVFGLGAILCEILTGFPPYIIPGGEELLRQAAAGELRPAFARLEKCGADAELVQLAELCLAPEKKDRPKDASVIADAVARYEAQLAERLKQAELARRAAKVKSAEQRKRRVLGLALATALIFLLAGAGFWWQNQRAQHALLQERVLADLQQIEKLQNQLLWDEAKIVLGKAESAANASGSDELRQRVDTARARLQLVQELDKIALDKIKIVDQRLNYRGTARDYESAFEKWKMGTPAESAGAVAGRLKNLPIKTHLVQALDDWAICTGDRDKRKWCLAVARLADPNPWRDRFRDATIWYAKSELEKLAADADPTEQPPYLLSYLASKLRQCQSDAATFLKKVLLHRPNSFWINFELGFYFTETAKNSDGKSSGVEYFQAALAARPDAAVNYVNLGWALSRKGDREGAINAYKKAIEMVQDNSLAWTNLGVAHAKNGNWEQAIKSYQKAIEIDPQYAAAYANLGYALAENGQIKKAIENCKTAVDLRLKQKKAGRPLAIAYTRLGDAYRRNKEVKLAITNYEKAIEACPTYGDAYINFFGPLIKKGKRELAIANLRKIIKLNPNYAKAYLYYGNAIYSSDQTGAIEYYRKAIKTDPQYSYAYSSLGYALYFENQLDGAAHAFQMAIKYDEKNRTALNFLGKTRLLQGEFAEAGEAFECAMKLRPSKYYADRISECARLLQLDAKLALIQKGQANPTDAEECIELAKLCKKYKKLYAQAAGFYLSAFTANPQLTKDSGQKYRFAAVKTALLAADRKGKGAAEIGPERQVRWRNQALLWLHAELKAQRANIKADPKTTIAIEETLAGWLHDPDLSGVRDDYKLTELSAVEQQQWRRFWAALRTLQNDAAANYASKKLEGALTETKREIVHKVTLNSGSTYVFDLMSDQFDCFLRLEDANGIKLSENDDIVKARIKNSRIKFAPPQNGDFRLVVTSFDRAGWGSYKVLIREFAGKKN